MLILTACQTMRHTLFYLHIRLADQCDVAWAWQTKAMPK